MLALRCLISLNFDKYSMHRIQVLQFSLRMLHIWSKILVTNAATLPKTLLSKHLDNVGNYAPFVKKNFENTPTVLINHAASKKELRAKLFYLSKLLLIVYRKASKVLLYISQNIVELVLDENSNSPNLKSIQILIKNLFCLNTN